MGNLLAYSGIVTKLRAMESKILTEDNFAEIANLHSVLEVVQYLRNNSTFDYILNLLEEGKLHRGFIERVLICELYQEYKKIYSFSNMEQRKFLKLYIKRHEIDMITYCFRNISAHFEGTFDLEFKKPFFDKYTQLSIDKLITSETPDDLIENLKDTEYYSALYKLKDKPNLTLFDYDLTLDQYYFSTLWKSSKKLLRKKELEVYKKEFGSQIDLLNLQWIYRAKKYYHMAPEEIYMILIPVHYRLSTDFIKELVETPGDEAFLTALKKTVYAKYSEYANSVEHHTIENIYLNCMYHLLTSDRRKNPYSIASLNTYLFIKEEEIKKLTTAIECIRYSLTPDETLTYVGGKNK
ncbi:MAG: V-type ATPase subunit [Schaedlerella sp.]|nr:V-type ATPase subunit [Schaedlerella sp.]